MIVIYRVYKFKRLCGKNRITALMEAIQLVRRT